MSRIRRLQGLRTVIDQESLLEDPLELEIREVPTFLWRKRSSRRWLQSLQIIC